MEWKTIDTPPAQPSADLVYESIEYLVTDGSRVDMCDFQRGNGCGKPWAEWSMYGGIHPDFITHWMPLPTLPKTEK